MFLTSSPSITYHEFAKDLKIAIEGTKILASCMNAFHKQTEIIIQLL